MKNKILLGISAFFGLYVAVSLLGSVITPSSHMPCNTIEDVQSSPNNEFSVFTSHNNCSGKVKTRILLGPTDYSDSLLVVYEHESSYYEHQNTKYFVLPVGIKWHTDNEVSISVGLGDDLTVKSDEHKNVKILLSTPKP